MIRRCYVILVLLMFTGLGIASAQTGEPGTLRNPLNPYGGADPWLTYYDGYYYLAATTWASHLTMRKSETLAGLKTAEPVLIYYEDDPSRCCNMWAPEFHLLDGPNGPRWYFYYSAGTAGTNDNQRMHVLESAGTDPLGPYSYKARIYDPANDVWSIDHSVLELDGSLYLLFSSWVGPNQSLFIASMSNPWTLSSSRVLISQPEYDWERQGLNVNEAPVALQHAGVTFIIYSASFCGTPEYKLGMLRFNGSDPLDPDSWEKHPEPVFQRADENGIYGPAHNGFFTSPDGTENWIVYHANDSLDDGCNGGRKTRVQRFTWNEDGTPDFGIPVGDDEVIDAPSGDMGIDPLPDVTRAVTISRFQSYGMEGFYFRHENFALRLAPVSTSQADSHFMIVPGLADPEAVSIESANFPGFYWRHQNNAVVLSSTDNSEDFAAEATWWIRPGIADEDRMSFESYDQLGHYIGRMMGIPALVELTDDMPEQAREDATFIKEQL